MIIKQEIQLSLNKRKYFLLFYSRNSRNSMKLKKNYMPDIALKYLIKKKIIITMDGLLRNIQSSLAFW